jgi:hypothetical protein
MNVMNFDEYVKVFEARAEIDPSDPDSYGESIGITDKSSSNYKKNMKKLTLPKSGPIGSIHKSALANLNVPTRGIPRTDNGNLGCAAAVSIIFYRATGLPIRKSRNREIELGTSSLWKEFTKSNKGEWTMITDWKNGYKPGDIILTSRGEKAGHIGVVVNNGKIISNSSGGFDGDKKGQIEMNYTIAGWNKVAKRNPTQTALFRYTGPYLQKWGSTEFTTGGSNDDDAIMQNIDLPEIIITADGIVQPRFVKPASLINTDVTIPDTLPLPPDYVEPSK